MVEEILTVAQASNYDFRTTAYPEDPLRHLFPEWVSYYRMKWAIARVPLRLLGSGVSKRIALGSIFGNRH
jgi:hypothetical protein